MLSRAGIDVHQLDYLRGVNPDVRSTITNLWAGCDRQHGGNPSLDQIMDFMSQIDFGFSGSLMQP